MRRAITSVSVSRTEFQYLRSVMATTSPYVASGSGARQLERREYHGLPKGSLTCDDVGVLLGLREDILGSNRRG